ncbi:MAG TPA: rod-binding protein [Candidatus Hydrogenedentes bacterium]|nr:rod-binding protein [Candidatus Hydrogenedentota bacterium]
MNPIISINSSASAEGMLGRGVGEATALKELERFFLFSLLREMRKSVPQDGLFQGGAEREIYEEMLDDAWSGAMADSGQIGIARSIEEQMRVGALQAEIRNQLGGRELEVK